MLSIKKSINITGQSLVNNKVIESYTARIEESNPQNIYITQNQLDQELYKENRVQCRKDREEFEEFAYQLQESMMEGKTNE